MRLIMKDGTSWELPGVSEGAVRDHFEPFSKDGYSYVDTAFRFAGGVMLWSGEKEDFEEHLKMLVEKVQEAEDEVSAEMRHLEAMEVQAEALMKIAVALERAVDEWITRGG